MKVLSTIKGIESDGIKSELSLDLYMRMERGIDGRWAIVWSEVIEVGPKVQQPIIKQGLLVHMVISFFNIQLANHTRRSDLQPAIQAFICNKY